MIENPPPILLIDKPVGMSSFDVIRVLKKQVGKRKMGHAGTLDPCASGLMIIGVDAGTKLLTELIGLPKEYDAEILIGEKTTTGDREGNVIESHDVPALDEHAVQKVLTEMHGIIRLPVSAYSAMKRGGVPFYKRARAAEQRGERLAVVPIRDMEVGEAKLTGLSCFNNRCIASVHFSVGSGTYIRSLAEEFGRRLGYPATLQNLRRTKVGEYSVDDASVLDN